MPPTRLITKPFLAVTAAAAAFFVYVGILVPIIPTFIDDELGAGEIGVGLSLASFAAAAICVRPVIGRLVERAGRRPVMIGGALLAGVAGMSGAFVHELWQLLVLRGVAGIGEAALFVGAATLIADLAPPARRAEAASYFSVAVFGGLGVGPIIGDAVLGDDRYARAFVDRRRLRLAGRAARARRAPRPRPRRSRPRPTPTSRRAAASSASCTPLPSDPGWSSRAASPASPSSPRSCPSTPATSDSAAPGRCSRPTASSASRCASPVRVGSSASAPAGPSPSRSHRSPSRSAASPLFPDRSALWISALLIGVASAFLYPSLMALTVNRADERERPMAISSFTMFFEVGNIAGGVVFGLIAELASKRAAFGSAVVLCGVGTWLLLARVVPVSAPERRTSPALVAAD